MKETMKRTVSRLLLAGVSLFALTGCAVAGDGTDSAASAASGGISILTMVAMLAVFYFILIRPEQKQKKKAEEMRNSLSVGDKITTIGGIVGKIVHINGDLITFETGEDRVRLQIAKWGVSANSIQKTETPNAN